MNVAKSAAYILGRQVRRLPTTQDAQDVAFAADRLDGQTLEAGTFKHCTFVNISFKNALLKSSQFLDCVFIGCYFRRATLESVRFVGCRFVDCNFSHVAIKGSDFGYSTFQGCQLPFEELFHSLPSEPNIREALARNLYLESSRLGLSAEARQYRMVEIRAREDHLHAAVLGRSLWYREHFDLLARVRAATALAGSLLNRWLWGYGERSWVLVRNVVLLAVIVFPLLYYLFANEFSKPGGGPVSITDLIQFSVASMVPGGIDGGVEATGTGPRLVALFETIFGLVAVGLFASHIFRWSLHR